jgi:nicotinamide-nucleotide amidase
VVAYDARVKFDLLGVEEGPVITEPCARQMAEGAAKVLGADAVVATTGAGGPDPEEGQPAGTAYLAVTVRGHTTCRRVEFEGEPAAVVEHTTREAVRMLREVLEDHA